MTPALTAAAERLITVPGFRWMPGMVDTDGYRFVDVSEGIIEIDGSLFQYSRGHYSAAVAALPDLTDPATLGCVLAMVREAYGDPGIGAVQSQSLVEGEPTWWLLMTGTQLFDAATEAECLVNALAAAGAK
jgi:hypothetical protein